MIQIMSRCGLMSLTCPQNVINTNFHGECFSRGQGFEWALQTELPSQRGGFLALKVEHTSIILKLTSAGFVI